jgi:hypothetical protein
MNGDKAAVKKKRPGFGAEDGGQVKKARLNDDGE